ncbi:hypothetical protein KM1_256660, partial [Entamoeba histolytica HM-3:IMSS]
KTAKPNSLNTLHLQITMCMRLYD